MPDVVVRVLFAALAGLFGWLAWFVLAHDAGVGGGVLFGVITFAFAWCAVFGWQAPVRPAHPPTPAFDRVQEQVRRGGGHGLVVFNDETHSYEYVIAALTDLCGLPAADAYRFTDQINAAGRGVVFVGSHAECVRRRRQFEERGPDPLVPHSDGPLALRVEELTGE